MVVARLEEKVKELERLLIRVVRVLVNLLDAKSPWTVGHSERVAEIAVRIAQQMDFDVLTVRTTRSNSTGRLFRWRPGSSALTTPTIQ